MIKRSYLLLVILLGSLLSQHAASQSIPKSPPFLLKISTTDASIPVEKVGMGLGIDVLEVNTSHKNLNVGRPNYPGRWYTMRVIKEGNPAEPTEEYWSLSVPRADSAVPQIMDSHLGILKPGESGHWFIALTRYFNFNSPGKYEITFSRGTDPGQPNNVEVTSNTIIVTVLPVGMSDSKKQNR